MANPYSEDLRKRAVEMKEEGKSIEEIVKVMKIGRSSIYLWWKRKREEGTVAARKEWRKGHGNKIKDLEKFKKFAEKNEGLTAKEMAEKWGNITLKTVCKWLNRIGFSRKKRATGTKKEMNRDVRYIWAQ